MSESPSHWCWISVGDISQVTGGLTQNSKRDGWPLKLPFLRVANVYANELRLDQVSNIGVQEAEIPRALLADGDLLVVEGNGSLDQIGRMAVWVGSISPCLHQNHLIKVRFLPKRISCFAMYWFLSSSGRDQITSVASSTSGLHTLSISKVQSLGMPLAPLQEQERIVSAIESYFTRLDDAVATLSRVERNLKRYRASVLKSAVEGRLVPTEAALAKQEGRDYEPASVLLERILTERRRRWTESGKKGKYQEPAPPDTTGLPELPEGWCWTTIGAVTESLDRLRVPVNKSERLNHVGDVPYYGANGQVGWIDKAIFNEPLVLVVEDETFTGREKPFCYKIVGPSWVNNHAHVLRPTEAISIDYLNYSLMFYPFVPLTTGTTGRRKLTQAALLGAPYALPPLREQQRIVSQVAEVLDTADAAARTAEKSRIRSMSLRQSILKWAFEGKLADQDPSDEPASVLLERIKAERDLPKSAKKKSRA